jgi:4-hydroxyphenylpyruvate dioxygenase-like putative hemolysin
MSVTIHRIAVAVHDLDAAVELYTKLFDGNFKRTGEAVGEEAGVHVAADMALGIELVHPVPGSANPVAQKLEKFLAERGEGIFGAGFSAPDMDAALAHASEAGIEPLLPTFKFTQEQIDHEFDGAFSRFEETPLDSGDQTGAIYAINVIDPV